MRANFRLEVSLPEFEYEGILFRTSCVFWMQITQFKLCLVIGHDCFMTLILNIDLPLQLSLFQNVLCKFIVY